MAKAAGAQRAMRHLLGDGTIAEIGIIRPDLDGLDRIVYGPPDPSPHATARGPHPSDQLPILRSP
jgi:hypothetical protein